MARRLGRRRCPARPASSLLIFAPSPGVRLARPSRRAAARCGRSGSRSALAKSQSRWSSAGHGHDGPGAVAHQHVVGHVDRHRSAPLNGLIGVGAGEDAALLQRPLGRLALDLGLDADPARRTRRPRSALVGGGELVDQRVLGRQHDVGHAEDGVGPGGEDPDRRRRRGPATGEVELGALGAADPVALHGLDPLRPVERRRGRRAARRRSR